MKDGLTPKVKRAGKKVGTQFTGPLARRLADLRKQTGLPANKLNEAIVSEFLPKIESGELVIVTGPDGLKIVPASK